MKELHVKSLLPVRLDKYLMDQYPALGMGRLNKALRENKIKLNGKRQPLSTRVQNGDTIKLFLTDEQLENRPTPPPYLCMRTTISSLPANPQALRWMGQTPTR